MKKRGSKIKQWLKLETPHKREALERASYHFDKNDKLNVHTLEAIYGQESSFGKNRRKRGIKGAAGGFQLEKPTAERMGLLVSRKNDQRFDVDASSAAAAKYLKQLDHFFSKKTTLTKKLRTIAVSNPSERSKFAIAAYNAGEGRIAKAQQKAKDAKANPRKWKEVQKHLGAAGASSAKVEEIQTYVQTVKAYEKEFSKKSKANKKAKFKKPKGIKKSFLGGHWITLEGRHIFIEE